MKEKLYTIPLNDAFQAHDECPFCYIERQIEQELLDFVLGSCSSYMESDVRDATDQAGFCRMHYQKMFSYGNTLGNGWILKTHLRKMKEELHTQINHFKPSKLSLSEQILRKKSTQNAITSWVQQKNKSCYICNQYEERYQRYLDTFYYLYQKESDFRKTVAESKGFCLQHFGDLCDGADLKLNAETRDSFYKCVFSIMEQQFATLEEDVSWLIEKFDYKNKDADWKNSKDSIQRSMQKLKGGYPADPPYQSKK